MISEEERYQQILEEEEKFKKTIDLTKGGTVISDKMMQGKGGTEKLEFDKKKYLKEKREEEFKKQFKNAED
jgi:hypothetical protein